MAVRPARAGGPPVPPEDSTADQTPVDPAKPDQPANPELLAKDPVSEFFGPGSGVRLHGEPTDEIPDEVRMVIEEHGLGKKSFSCMLKEIPARGEGDGPGGASVPQYIKGFTRGVPTPDFIAREYGPGNYLLCFSWQVVDADGTRRMDRQEIPLVVSEKVVGLYKKQRFENKIKDALESGTRVQEALVEKTLESKLIGALTGEQGKPAVDPAVAAKSYLQEALETARMLGLAPQVQKSIEWDKILPAVMTGVTAFLTMQQNAEQARRDEFNKMLMLLMNSSQTANNQLLEVMKAQSGQGSGNMAIREFKDMILGALDIKEVLSGNSRETLGDKIFHLIESVAPSILSIAAATANNAAAAANNPAVKIAKGYVESNADFQALKHDPVEMKKVIDRMDQTYGWRQVDHILQTMGWPRPDNCPRLPQYENPAQDEGPQEAEVVE